MSVCVYIYIYIYPYMLYIITYLTDEVIMATNRIESLDPAMIRPGRASRLTYDNIYLSICVPLSLYIYIYIYILI